MTARPSSRLELETVERSLDHLATRSTALLGPAMRLIAERRIMLSRCEVAVDQSARQRAGRAAADSRSIDLIRKNKADTGLLSTLCGHCAT